MKSRYTNRSKMGGNKEQKRRARSTKTHRRVNKIANPYGSLADRFSPSPESHEMEISLTTKQRKPQVDFANIIEGRRTRTQTAMGKQYREQKELDSRRSVTRHHRKKINKEVDDLAEMFSERTRLGGLN
jgi:hypothetical protein